MNTEYKVRITEIIARIVWVTVASPLEAQRIAEEDYIENMSTKSDEVL